MVHTSDFSEGVLFQVQQILLSTAVCDPSILDQLELRKCGNRAGHILQSFRAKIGFDCVARCRGMPCDHPRLTIHKINSSSGALCHLLPVLQ